MRTRLYMTICCSMVGFITQLIVHASEDYQKVKISVYYESLCPDSVNFFKEQLGPVWPKFYNYITLDPVPYGNAKQHYVDGHWKFNCQHGENECYYNKIQACAIYQLKYKRPKAIFKFLTCVMSSTQQNRTGPLCAQKYNINYDSLIKCATSVKGENLLAKLGNRTHSFQPAITWVPTVVFNDVYNKDDAEEAEDNLKSVICKYIDDKPEECDKYDD